MKSLLTFIFSLLSVFAISQDIQTSLDSLLESEVSIDDPALFIGVVKDGEVSYQGIRGMANLQHQVSASEQTRCNIASTAKQFTALMVLDLANKGSLSLEDDIRDYLPTLYPEVEFDIKIRHLINHTSGVRDYCDLMGLQGTPWWRREGLDNEDVLEYHEAESDLAFEPGSYYSYSNSGYVLLALIIEKVTEERFAEYSKSFFEELGMTATQFPSTYMEVIPNEAIPYSNWGGSEWKEYPRITSTAGEGFLYTTLADQLHFEVLLQNASITQNELLSESQGKIPNSEKQFYGYGLNLTAQFGRACVHHAGATGSYGSQVYRFPEEKLSVFVMTNNGSINADQIATKVVEMLLEEVELAITFDERLNTVSSQPLESNRIGQYKSPTGRLVRIVKVEGELLWRSSSSGGITLIADSENTFHPYYSENLKIGFYEDKMVLFESDGEVTEYVKLSEEESAPADPEQIIGEYVNEALDRRFSFTRAGDGVRLRSQNWNEPEAAEIVNRDEIVYMDYHFEIVRDIFGRVIALSVSKGRALNVRFEKNAAPIYHPKDDVEEGSVSVTTVWNTDGSACDILLTKNLPNGNEVWNKFFGGTSYDKASSVYTLDDGFLIVGSTSSYGAGNYNIFIVRTDTEGNTLWQNSYGREMNDYGYTAEVTPEGFLIRGTTQDCQNDVFDCTTYLWEIYVGFEGEEISNRIGMKVD